MAHIHLGYLDLAPEKISGTDPDQDAESFIHSIERKVNFVLGDAPGEQDESANQTFRKKAFFSSLLRRPAAEWFENNISRATPWEIVLPNFITRFSEGRNNFWYRMEVEHCITGYGEGIRNFLHRIERTVDKGWPNDLNGIEAGQQKEKRNAQARQRRQR